MVPESSEVFENNSIRYCIAFLFLVQADQPPYLVPGEDLKQIRMLNVFEPCTLQIGDRNFYTLKETDAVMSKVDWKRLEKDQLSKSKAVKQKKVAVHYYSEPL